MRHDPLIWWKDPQKRRAKARAFWRIVGVIVGAFALGLFIVLVPAWQASRVPWYATKAFEVENEARKTLATILGGIAVLAGLFLTYRRLRAFETTVELSISSQVTERFSKAIDQLAGDKLELRLGGIYALERVARDSEADHWPVMEILSTYLRERATSAEAVARGEFEEAGVKKKVPGIKVDLQAILTVIGRRVIWHHEPDRINLHGAVLRQALLKDAHLRRAVLSDVDFLEADLSDAIMEHAELSFATFESAVLRGTILQGITGWGAGFKGAKMARADFTRADLNMAFFGGAELEGAKFVQANLSYAKLTAETELDGADFDRAILSGTLLHNVDLSGALNLSREQLSIANVNVGTKLPAYLS